MRWKQSIDVLKTYVLQMVDAPYERVKEGLVGHLFHFVLVMSADWPLFTAKERRTGETLRDD